MCKFEVLGIDVCERLQYETLCSFDREQAYVLRTTSRCETFRSESCVIKLTAII